MIGGECLLARELVKHQNRRRSGGRRLVFVPFDRMAADAVSRRREVQADPHRLTVKQAGGPRFSAATRRLRWASHDDRVHVCDDAALICGDGQLDGTGENLRMPAEAPGAQRIVVDDGRVHSLVHDTQRIPPLRVRMDETGGYRPRESQALSGRLHGVRRHGRRGDCGPDFEESDFLRRNRGLERTGRDNAHVRPAVQTRNLKFRREYVRCSPV